MLAGGRYLNDVWTLKLDKLAWAAAPIQAPEDEKETESTGDAPPPAASTLPPCAGHVLVPWADSLLCIGGHMKVSFTSSRHGLPGATALFCGVYGSNGLHIKVHAIDLPR